MIKYRRYHVVSDERSDVLVLYSDVTVHSVIQFYELRWSSDTITKVKDKEWLSGQYLCKTKRSNACTFYFLFFFESR